MTTMRHGNRARRSSSREQALREAECLDPVETHDIRPSESDIRQRAYEIYVRRGEAPGTAELDWLQAECELRSCKAAACSS